MSMKNQVRYKKVFNQPGYAPVYEVHARRKWQTEWTILRVWSSQLVASADVRLVINRGAFTKEEKNMMKGAS